MVLVPRIVNGTRRIKTGRHRGEDQNSGLHAAVVAEAPGRMFWLCSAFQVSDSSKLGWGGFMSRTWKQNLWTVPCIGVSLLPKLACPLCWPAYAGLLSSVGLGFLISAKYLLPITGAFLVLAVGGLAFRAKHRRGYGPLALGLAASGVVLTMKFALEFNIGVYLGVG